MLLQDTEHDSKSKDLSAAMVIARRGLGFNEKAKIIYRDEVTGKLKSISIKTLLPESVKEGKYMDSRGLKSNWSLWSSLKKAGIKKPSDLTGPVSSYYSKTKTTQSCSSYHMDELPF